MHHRLRAPLLGAAAAVLLVTAFAPMTASAADFPPYDAGYHTYAEMVADIQATQAAHPDIVALRSIGKSYQGRDLWVAKVSDNVAVDEPEPEVMFDGLHHAREHLSLEQTLAILHWLTDGYGVDQRITDIVDTTEDPDRLRGQPRRRGIRPDRLAVPCVAQESSAESRVDLHRDRHEPQLRLPLGLLRRVIEHEIIRDVPRDERVLDAGGARHARLHGQSSGSMGASRSKTAITFHTAGQQILWPYGYTKTDVPGDMTTDDHAALVALGKKMAASNGYTAMQSSGLYVTDGD